MSRSLRFLTICSSFLSIAFAQTWTACDPMNGTCPDDLALGISNYTVDFTQALDQNVWNHTNGVITPTSSGSEFTISQRYQSPTVQSIFYIFFGVVEIHMKAASGQGIISSIVLESDDLDEIDWEWIGGNNTMVQSNYFGKGNQTSFDRAKYHDVATPMDDFHNYTTHWTSEFIEWIIDGQVVRTLNYADANGGNNFPQTPCTVRLGIWAGGDPSNSPGTIEWAGGETDFTKGPYTMYVQSAKISDYGTGKAYHWSDQSGSFESIQSVSGNSTAATAIASPSSSTTSEPLSEKWNAMSSGAKIGVYAGSAVGAVAIAGLITLCCIKQRRRGRADRAAEEARQEAQRLEDAKFEDMDTKEQDQLQMSAMTPAQYETNPAGAMKAGFYEPSIAESDLGSINKYNMNGTQPRPTTPLTTPNVYHDTAYNANRFSPAQQTSTYDFPTPPPQYPLPPRSPRPMNNPAGGGFNFNPNAPSRSFSGGSQGGYTQVRSASPMQRGYPQSDPRSNGYPGRNFSPAPRTDYAPQAYPPQQSRW